MEALHSLTHNTSLAIQFINETISWTKSNRKSQGGTYDIMEKFAAIFYDEIPFGEYTALRDSLCIS